MKGWVSVIGTFSSKGANMSKFELRKTLLLVMATGLAVAATTLGVAQADPTNDSRQVSAAGVTSVVEDFTYPNAAQIEEETGAVLKRGDGRLVFMACDGSEDINIESAHGQLFFCFRLIAKPAFLALEIPKAYGIWTTDDPVKATIQKVDGTSIEVDAPAGTFTGYGEAGGDRERTTLIELRVEG
ncbi:MULTISPECIES: hypothetical protein [Streptomyces]|uniref:hypothetical protein n=1 Tax=Streptomyces TaxID=1883 RepID=UPI000BEF6879|nr:MULTISPECIES: hypothetical protein [unclassified Streptomyces]WTE29922.1 hypothetical protein OHB50_31795 [Streptomyces anulatus]